MWTDFKSTNGGKYPFDRSFLAFAMGMFALAPAAHSGTIYFSDFNRDADTGTIYRIESDGSGLTPLIDVGGGVRGLAIDLAAGHIYWANVNTQVIYRAALDGSDIQEIVNSGLLWPRAVALDLGTNSLFWGDQLTSELGRADLNSGESAPLRSTPFHAGLAIDAPHGKLYWSVDQDMFTGDIVRGNLDGSEVETIVTGVDKPANLAIDVAGGKLYWVDYVVDVVRRSNLAGSDVEDLYIVGSNRNPRGIALDLAAGKVYWGQDDEIYGETGTLMRMNLDGSNPEPVVEGLSMIVDVSLGATKSFSPGDLNCSGTVDFDDIDPFVLALTRERDYEDQFPNCNLRLADINNDGAVDFNDIDPFVELLTG